jgi:hypothetical protein
VQERNQRGQGLTKQEEIYPSRSPPREPVVLANHHRQLAFLANLWRERI